MEYLFYLFLITLTSAAAEYFYFNQKLFFQRRQILTLTTENSSLKTKINKQKNLLSSLNMRYSDVTYKYGFAMEHTSILLLPVEDSPTIHKCLKSIRVNIFYEADVNSQKWYEVGLSINNTLVKGFLKESEIKFVVEESC
jgi:hypothetical protein